MVFMRFKFTHFCTASGCWVREAGQVSSPPDFRPGNSSSASLNGAVLSSGAVLERQCPGFVFFYWGAGPTSTLSRHPPTPQTCSRTAGAQLWLRCRYTWLGTESRLPTLSQHHGEGSLGAKSWVSVIGGSARGRGRTAPRVIIIWTRLALLPAPLVLTQRSAPLCLQLSFTRAAFIPLLEELGKSSYQVFRRELFLPGFRQGAAQPCRCLSRPGRFSSIGPPVISSICALRRRDTHRVTSFPLLPAKGQPKARSAGQSPALSWAGCFTLSGRGVPRTMGRAACKPWGEGGCCGGGSRVRSPPWD